MTRFPLRPLALASLALITHWAAAQGMATGQAYAGASIGGSKYDLNCTGATVCDRSGIGWKLFGGYMVHPNFGIELDVRHHGESDLSGTVGGAAVTNTFKAYGAGLYGLGQVRSGAFSAFGKAGLAWMRGSGVAAVADLGAPDRESHVRPAWGLGIGWDFTKTLSARLEFERVRVKFGGDKFDADLVSAGIISRF